MEQYLGTDPNNLDSDDDGYPDGVEVMNILNPFTQEASSVEFIPLGFNPEVGSTLDLWVTARDATNHLRPGVLVSYTIVTEILGGGPDGQVNITSSLTDRRGLGQTQVSLALFVNATVEPLCATGKEFPSYCRKHWVTAHVGSESSRIYLPAMPIDEDPLIYFKGNQSNGIVNLISEEDLIVKVRDSYGNPLANAPVLFRVLAPSCYPLPPDGFENAAFSPIWTQLTEPIEYPASHPWREWSAGAVNQLTVPSDHIGFAYARFYYGNTSNCTYNFEAVLGASVVQFEAETSNYEVWRIYTTDGRILWPEKAFQGQEIPLSLWGVEFSKQDDECFPSLGMACAYNMQPYSLSYDLRYFHEGVFYPLETITADAQGVARTTLALGDSLSSYSLYAGNDPLFDVQFVPKAEAHIMQMWRVTDQGAMVNVPDGGTVLQSDSWVILQIKNPISYYLELKVEEQGGDLLDPSGTIPFPQGEGENDILVIRWLIKYYFFKLVKPAQATGEVHFTLKDPSSGDVLSYKMVYFQECCKDDKIRNLYDNAYKEWRHLPPFSLMNIGEFSLERTKKSLSTCGLMAEVYDYCTPGEDRHCGTYSGELKNYMTERVGPQCGCAVDEKTRGGEGTWCGNICNHTWVIIDCYPCEGEILHLSYDPYWRACLPFGW